MISDPGSQLVATVAAAGHRIIPLPGPSAAVAAVVASGLPSGDFRFIGFLPPKTAARRKLLEAIKGELSHIHWSHTHHPPMHSLRPTGKKVSTAESVKKPQRKQLRMNPSHVQVRHAQVGLRR